LCNSSIVIYAKRYIIKLSNETAQANKEGEKMKRFIVDYVDALGIKDFTCVDARDELEAVQEFYKKAAREVGYEAAVNNHKVTGVEER
jgi:hypothetical protein